MVMAPRSRTFLSVPERTAGMFSSVDGGGAVRSAPLMSSAAASRHGSASMPMASATTRAADRVMAGSRSRGHRPWRDRGHDLLLGRAKLLLVLGDGGGGERVADHVGGAAAHVEELVDSEDQKQARLRNAELLERRQDHHQRGARYAGDSLRG